MTPTPRIPSVLRKTAEALVTSEAEMAKLEPLWKAAEKRNKELRDKLHTILTDLGYDSIALDGIGRLRPSFMGPYVKIKRDDQGSNEEAIGVLRIWAEKNGLYDVIFKSSPSTQRLAQIVKQHLEEGNVEYPPGVDHYLLKGVVFTPEKSTTKRKKK